MSAPGTRDAYNLAAGAWSAGPATVYAKLARALVARAPVPVAGCAVLDLGAGTGVAGSAARAAGARGVVAVDLAEAMLRRLDPPARAVHADANRLPFRAGAFDLVVAAYSLGHLVDPVGALRESRRVGAAVVASAFEPGWAHPAKGAIDAALAPFGFVPPAWYVELKHSVEPRVDGTRALATIATEAGYDDVRVEVVEVDTGLGDPPGLVAWRLGMAHLAPFVLTLDRDDRARAVAAAEAAVAGAPPLVIPMAVLAAR